MSPSFLPSFLPSGSGSGPRVSSATAWTGQQHIWSVQDSRGPCELAHRDVAHADSTEMLHYTAKSRCEV